MNTGHVGGAIQGGVPPQNPFELIYTKSRRNLLRYALHLHAYKGGFSSKP